MDFSFHITLTEKDYFDFNLFHMLESNYGKKHFLQMRILLAAILMIGGLLNLLYDGVNTATLLTLALFAILAVLAFFCYKPYLRLFLKLYLKNLKKQGRLPFSSEATIDFGDDCFVETTQTNKSEYSYSVVEAVYLVNESIFYIFISSAQAILIPVSAFDSQQQYDAFKSFLAEKTVAVKMQDFERSPFLQPRFSVKPE